MDDSAPGQAAAPTELATAEFAAEEFPTEEIPAVADPAAAGAHGADPDWVVLASPAAAARPGRAPSPARAAGLVTFAAVVVAAVVALGGLLVSQRIAEQQAVHDVAELTDDLAVSVVQPALTDAMATDPAQARVALDPLVRHWLGGVGEMVRVKVWTTRGTVLYSDEPQLTGQTFPLDDDLRAVFRPARTEADITDLSRPENRYERGQGRLLEVYRPVWTPGGTPLLFETYFRYDTVSQRSGELWRGFAGVILSSLIALLLLLGAGGWLLAARGRRAAARNEELMRRALDASDAERRRIAATLHDGVVQQLVAASFVAAGQARRAVGPDGDPGLAADLDNVATTVRDGIAGLRSLLVDIYPPSLHTAGLASALRDLADAASRAGGQVPAIQADLDAATADAVPGPEREAMFRIAQEAVRNAVRHSRASQLTLRLTTADGGPVLEVADDSDGFDAVAVAGTGTDGHFGLRLMTEAARHGGGWLALRSAPGTGTVVRYEAAPR
jgi:signal transduction histidine kinase